jgi:hypothetical protein
VELLPDRRHKITTSINTTRVVAISVDVYVDDDDDAIIMMMMRWRMRMRMRMLIILLLHDDYRCEHHPPQSASQTNHGSLYGECQQTSENSQID